ncbi:MAG: transketolase [candidate division WOR-3 bacterium]
MSNNLKNWFKEREEYRFKSKKISKEVLSKLEEIAHLCRGDILKMTTVAGSGHPGGSLSSIDIFTTVYSLADLTKDEVVVSHGHTSPGVYAILGRLGILDIEEVITFFRHISGPYEGHVESHLPGIVWSTGNLGQGLSAACGFALAKKLKGDSSRVFALMSDAEQAKGQVAEARRFASKFKCNNITVVIDYNNRQISGKVEDIMPINIKEDYLADGWKVLEVCGHDIRELYEAIHNAINDESKPYAIIANTIMCKGVPFIEGDESYHGKALSKEELDKALKVLGIENDIEKYIQKRNSTTAKPIKKNNNVYPLPKLNLGKPIEYKVGEKVANRDAYGNALADLAKINEPGTIVVTDCDLASSVKTDKFAKIHPDYFIQNGVSEHNTATISGVLSIRGFQTFYSDFGVFSFDETYNQHRLNAINNTKLRIVSTHNGLNVGEDGKTHQCIDYIGLIKNIPGFSIIIPADANQTDRVIRYITKMETNVAVVVGREKSPIIEDENGKAFFGGDYQFEYGKIDRVREGKDGIILSYGYTLFLALQARKILQEKGFELAIWNVSCPLAIRKEDVKKITEYKNVFTYEEHLINSGLGCILGNLMAKSGTSVNFHSYGVLDFSPSGSAEDLFKALELSPEAIAEKIEKALK